MVLKYYKWNEQCKSIDTNHLVVLCEIGEDYKLFCNDLEKLIKSETNKDLVNKVYQVIQGKFSLCANKYKSFIEKHEHTIEIMKKYHCLRDLTVLSYDRKGNRRENLPEDYFYQYIQNSRENIDKIKAVALKLKKLGFDEIKFGENLNFTEYEFELDNLYDSDFAFLENIEVNPTYLNNPIKYRTNTSNYCMCLRSRVYGDKKDVGKYSKEIYLNNLIFESNSLPDEISVESTIDVINKLAESKKTEYLDIKNTVDLSVATSDLKSQFECFKQIAVRIDRIKNKEDLLNVFEQMHNIIIELQNFSDNFDKEIINSNTAITEQTLQKEKKLYLNRRNSINYI